jgi:hypothetical protein
MPAPSMPMHIEIDRLDQVMESCVLLISSEAGYARDYRNGTAFGADKDRRRLDAFALGILDALSGTLGPAGEVLPALIYLKTLLDHGPGWRARAATYALLGLAEESELTRYVAGGRRLVLRMLAGRAQQPGIFASLLEEELQEQ